MTGFDVMTCPEKHFNTHVYYMNYKRHNAGHVGPRRRKRKDCRFCQGRPKVGGLNNDYNPQKLLAITVRSPALATALQRRPRSDADDARSFDARAVGGRAAMPVCGSLARHRPAPAESQMI
jgi:hypothetical protein